MKLFKFGAAALTLGLTMSLIALTGCGGSTTTGGGTKPPDEPTPGGGEKQPLAVGKGIIEGTATYDGTLPDMDKLTETLVKQIKEKSSKDAHHCLNEKAGDDAKEQEWRINPEN